MKTKDIYDVKIHGDSDLTYIPRKSPYIKHIIKTVNINDMKYIDMIGYFI